MKTYRGKYIIKNPDKYVGDEQSIVYRSGWELKFMNYIDLNENIINWSSEEIAIPYKNPITSKTHRYFPDFLIKYYDRNGELKVSLIEVKPYAQTQPPKIPKRITRKYKEDKVTYAINCAKWEAAIKFCEKKGWDFKILTEKELFTD